jgi:hypothetical protein
VEGGIYDGLYQSTGFSEERSAYLPVLAALFGYEILRRKLSMNAAIIRLSSSGSFISKILTRPYSVLPFPHSQVVQ